MGIHDSHPASSPWQAPPRPPVLCLFPPPSPRVAGRGGQPAPAPPPRLRASAAGQQRRRAGGHLGARGGGGGPRRRAAQAAAPAVGGVHRPGGAPGSGGQRGRGPGGGGAGGVGGVVLGCAAVGQAPHRGARAACPWGGAWGLPLSMGWKPLSSRPLLAQTLADDANRCPTPTSRCARRRRPSCPRLWGRPACPPWCAGLPAGR